jgi:hypothetical protein
MKFQDELSEGKSGDGEYPKGVNQPASAGSWPPDLPSDAACLATLWV